jgi:hypothetical protein
LLIIQLERALDLWKTGINPLDCETNKRRRSKEHTFAAEQWGSKTDSYAKTITRFSEAKWKKVSEAASAFMDEKTESLLMDLAGESEKGFLDVRAAIELSDDE